MSISLSNITGGAQTGLTTPGYTVGADQPPDNAAKQWLVNALSGTQTGVTAHSATSPFTIAFWRPKVVKILGALGINGRYTSYPINTSKVVVRKGVMVAANQPPQIMIIRVEMDVPAGAETYDSNSVRAALSAAIGALSQVSSGLGDSLIAASM